MNTTKRLLIFGIPFGIALLLVIRSTFFAEAQPVLRPNPSPTPEVLGNGWYRFTDTEAGYSIDYPSSGYLSVSKDVVLDYQSVDIAFRTSDGFQWMRITIHSNHEGLSPGQFIKQKIYQGKPPKKGKDIPLVATKIAGLDAMKMEMVPYDPAILITARNRVYFLALSYDMQGGNAPTQEAIDLFYQTINTFSLVPGDVSPISETIFPMPTVIPSQ